MLAVTRRVSSQGRWGFFVDPGVPDEPRGTPARILGASDRGVLAAGWKADVNVIDLERVAERMPEFVHDFPGGAGRFTV